jgi:hypothetical protein
VTASPNRDVIVERLSRLRSLLGEMRDIGVPTPGQLQSDHVTRYALPARTRRDIDDELLAAALRQVLDDYDQYVRQVAQWLERGDPRS